MSEQPMAPDWQVSTWFNSKTAPSLAQLRGKVVLLHAFQMLCPGCVSHAVPQAERVHRAYGGEGMAVIGLPTVFEHHVAMTPVALEAFLHEYRVTHPVGVDAAVAGDPIPVTMRRYGLRGTPSLLLLDRAGRVRLHEFGQVDDLRLGLLIGRLIAEDAGTGIAAPVRTIARPVEGSCDGQACPADRSAPVRG